MRTICEHPKARDKIKLIVFDCCRDGSSVQMLDMASETFVGFAAKMGTGSWIYEDRGCAFTDKLAERLQAQARTHDIDSLFMEVRREMTSASADADADHPPPNAAPPAMSSLSRRVLLA